jgi:type VI protein secretion system component Hcp
MSWDSDPTVDWEELQSIVQALPRVETSLDFGLWVDTGAQLIMGDGADKSDDEWRLSAYGYLIKNQFLKASKEVQNSAVIVARYVDAATASLSSFLNNGRSGRPNAKVTLKCFKAGTQVDGAETPASLELELEGARLVMQAIIGASPNGMPAEILAFTYTKLTINTRSQLTSGINGAVRTCQFGS